MEVRMTEGQWQAFTRFRTQFKEKCTKWNGLSSQLYPLQRDASIKDTPPYPQETAVVYNTALDEFSPNDDIRLIVIGDNPGKEEQLSTNRKYLVGQSGRIAEGFFRRNPELHIDFRKNVLILNKTPIHTAKTGHLHYLEKNGSLEVQNLIQETQKWMAQATAELHHELVKASDGLQITQLWLVGYAELKGKGLFLPYRDYLKESYFIEENNNKMGTVWENVFVYQHFSMNRFLIDLKSFRMENKALSLNEALEMLGHRHRDEIFGTI